MCFVPLCVFPQRNVGTNGTVDIAVTVTNMGGVSGAGSVLGFFVVDSLDPVTPDAYLPALPSVIPNQELFDFKTFESLPSGQVWRDMLLFPLTTGSRFTSSLVIARG